MAKEKKTKEEAPSPDDFIERVFKDVEKDFGAGVMVDGMQAVNDVKTIIPWTPSLDIITSGGIEEGSWVGITGNEKTGKTCASLTFAASAQRPEYGSRPVYYGKVEGRLSLHHLQGIKGLDLSRGKFHIIQSAAPDPKKGTPGKILTAQDHLSIYLNILRTVPNALLIIDSISALCNEEAMDANINENAGVAADARLFSRFLQLASNLVPVQKSIVIGITHLISNIKPGGAQYAERAARRWKYQCDYQLRTLMKTAWKSSDRQIGLEIKWACNTSPLGPPGMTTASFLRFGVGFDRLYEVCEYGCAANLIKQKGSWMTLEFLAREPSLGITAETAPKFQGKERVYEALLEHPEWAAVLEREVRSIAAGLAGIASE